MGIAVFGASCRAQRSKKSQRASAAAEAEAIVRRPFGCASRIVLWGAGKPPMGVPKIARGVHALYPFLCGGVAHGAIGPYALISAVSVAPAEGRTAAFLNACCIVRAVRINRGSQIGIRQPGNTIHRVINGCAVSDRFSWAERLTEVAKASPVRRVPITQGSFMLFTFSASQIAMGGTWRPLRGDLAACK